MLGFSASTVIILSLELFVSSRGKGAGVCTEHTFNQLYSRIIDILSVVVLFIYKPQISNQSSCHTMLLLLSEIGVEVASVSLVLKE